MKKMKRMKRILIVICTVLIYTNVPITASSISEYTTEFQYPIEPGMNEWLNLNHGEQVLALQIPDTVLENMGTEALIDIVLSYPLFVDMIFYNSFQEGFEAVEQNFNGLRELLSRPDAGSYLLKSYREYNISKVTSLRSEQAQFEALLDLLYLESILAQPEISSNMSKIEVRELMELVQYNYEIQLSNSATYPSLSFSAYYESLVEQQSITTFDISGNAITPNGTQVPIILRTGTDTAYNNRQVIKTVIENTYSGATVVGDATIKYNCHAYAWDDNTYVWMNDPSAYMTDGSYTLKNSDNPSATGQKAYYPGIGQEHSGNVIRLTGNAIRSKWGEQSLVEHGIGNCPYFFIPLSVKFYGR